MNLFVARQPIFDTSNGIAGYELLYRHSASAQSADPRDPTQMSSDVIIQSFLEIGMERLTGGHPGFVNFTRDMLLEGTYELFDPGSIVVELIESVAADAEVIAACERLSRSGFRLALDDYEEGGIQEPLIPFASILKLDLLGREVKDIRRVAERLLPHGVTLLAERVETEEVVEQARRAGFSLFQGYFYSKPETVSHKGGSIEALRILPLMNLIQEEGSTDTEIERAFQKDPGLSYKLLQIVNSPWCGGRGVQSIVHALRMLGRRPLHRWLALLFASSLVSSGGQSPEMVRTSLLRARCLETLGTRTRANAGSLFLLGLFSIMDVLLQIPMPELLSRVHFAPEVHGALLRQSASPYLRWLELVEGYEAGRWEDVSAAARDLGVPADAVPAAYLEALQWASTALDGVEQS